MKNKKLNRIIALVVIIIIVIIGVVFFILNFTSDDTSLSIVEKNWITNNANTYIDVNVYNDIPVYGYNGSGIIFDFLEDFTEEYNINFNKLSYYMTDSPTYDDIAFKILDANDNVSDNDILMYEDNYVVLALENDSLSSVNDITSYKMGILESDSDLFQDYLDNSDNITSFEDVDSLVKSLIDKELDYIIIPNMMYMDKILSNDLNIVYHISDLNKKYVLTVSDSDIYSIMNKYYNEYISSSYITDYSEEFLNIYFNSTETSEIDQKNYNGVVYKYGYVVNMPYENYASKNFVGTISNYLSDFEKIANVEINVIRYDSIDELKSALVSKEIDFALANFDYSSLNLDSIVTDSFKDLDYVVLSYEDISVNSIKGFKNYEISVIGSSNLYNLVNSYGITTNLYSDTDDLIRNINYDSVVIMDKDTYIYYKNEKLSDYKVVYEDTITNNYRFIINSDYETFAKLFNYYINSVDYNDIKYEYNTDIMISEDYKGIGIAIVIIIIIIVTIVVAVMINKRRTITNNMNKDDRLKYIDPMTSLKNRNYLNHNIYKWDDNVIFPQSIIVLDIDNIKEVNDRLGREAGDEIIKKVASVLINNQLENTDIIRSGGDEFLIYMIGYDVKDTVEYMRKLSRLMKNIPDCDGVGTGYSMILDEVKTVDDAINEAILMLTKNKEKNR